PAMLKVGLGDDAIGGLDGLLADAASFAIFILIVRLCRKTGIQIPVGLQEEHTPLARLPTTFQDRGGDRVDTKRAQDVRRETHKIGVRGGSLSRGLFEWSSDRQ